MNYKVKWQIVWGGGKPLTGIEEIYVRSQKLTMENRAEVKRLARFNVYQTHLKYCSLPYRAAIALVDILGVEAVEAVEAKAEV